MPPLRPPPPCRRGQDRRPANSARCSSRSSPGPSRPPGRRAAAEPCPPPPRPHSIFCPRRSEAPGRAIAASGDSRRLRWRSPGRTRPLPRRPWRASPHRRGSSPLRSVPPSPKPAEAEETARRRSHGRCARRTAGMRSPVAPAARPQPPAKKPHTPPQSRAPPRSTSSISSVPPVARLNNAEQEPRL